TQCAGNHCTLRGVSPRDSVGEEAYRVVTQSSTGIWLRTKAAPEGADELLHLGTWILRVERRRDDGALGRPTADFEECWAANRVAADHGQGVPLAPEFSDEARR